jgi:L-threonylcarbamoyladenylate synthase
MDPRLPIRNPDFPVVNPALAPGLLEDTLHHLEKGGLALLPVDTVPGLAVRADLPFALDRLTEAKARPGDKVYSLVFRNLGQVEEWLMPGPGLLAGLARLLPGPLTVVVPGNPRLGWLCSAWEEGVGIRLPGACPCSSLLETLPWPLALSSANISGAATPRRMAEVDPDLAALARIWPGDCPLGQASTVVDVRGGFPVLLREGVWSRKQVEAAWSTA